MSRQSLLSFKHNMTWGFIPVLVSMLLSEFAPLGVAIYSGAALGIGFSAYTFFRKEAQLPQILLYGTSAMLVLLAVTYYFHAASCPPQWYPLSLETGTLLLICIFYLNRKPLVTHYTSRKRKRRPSTGSVEATIVSARVVLLFGLLHLLTLLFAHTPMQEDSKLFLHHVAPPAVFVLSILFNQIGINYFNHIMKRTTFVPIVNAKGDVTGKVPAAEALSQKQRYMIPFIRVAVTLNGMLYLCPRPYNAVFEEGRTDLPVEGYLFYGETLKQGICRLVHQVFPEAPMQDLMFNFKYRLDNSVTNRLVYVFTLTINHESELKQHKGRPGKLWTIPQIEQNLGRNFFCSSFENEYNQIFSIIDECSGNISAHNAH